MDVCASSEEMEKAHDCVPPCILPDMLLEDRVLLEADLLLTKAMSLTVLFLNCAIKDPVQMFLKLLKTVQLGQHSMECLFYADDAVLSSLVLQILFE